MTFSELADRELALARLGLGETFADENADRIQPRPEHVDVAVQRPSRSPYSLPISQPDTHVRAALGQRGTC